LVRCSLKCDSTRQSTAQHISCV